MVKVVQRKGKRLVVNVLKTITWWIVGNYAPMSHMKMFSKTKFTVHIEIDRCDENKVTIIEQYFNSGSCKVDDNFLGTPLVFCPVFDYFASDEVKQKILDHSVNQENLGKSVKCI